VNELEQTLAVERALRRRGQWFWRIVSIVAAALLGLIGWPWALAGFVLFQFIVYATYWHSVRRMEQFTGLSEVEQAEVLAAVDARH
jgi:membrane protein implicated in regulation of membrane protease activity